MTSNVHWTALFDKVRKRNKLDEKKRGGIGKMENVKVKKSKALEILKANRTQHHKIFLEAVEGYKEKAQELLERRLEEIKKGKLMSISIALPLPQDQTKDYDRAIRMLELSVEDTVELDESSFASYIMDDWHWKRQFLSSNSAYSQTATVMMAQESPTEY